MNLENSDNEENSIDFRLVSQKYEKNPFIYDKNNESDVSGLDINKHIKYKRQYIGKDYEERGIVNLDTGALEGGMGFFINKKLDDEPFIKFYVKNISLVFDLSKLAQKCLYVIVTNYLKPNADKVYIDLNDMRKVLDYSSKQQVYKGMKELYNNKFIAPAISTGWWYINPKYFFNGDRLVLVNVVEKNKNNGKADELQSDSGDTR